jgi:hypothetical protein
MLTRGLVLSAVFAAGCTAPPSAPPHRAELRRTGGTTFELVPTAGQYPFCLAYTVTKAGLTRQLTMSAKNQSFECPAAQPVGHHAFKVPLEDGPVKVMVFFTSQAVNAGSVSQQIIEASNRQQLTALNLRLPGSVAIDSLDFAPEQDVPAEVGGIIGADGGLPGGEGSSAK